jgi:hypothetical protein
MQNYVKYKTKQVPRRVHGILRWRDSPRDFIKSFRCGGVIAQAGKTETCTR